MPAEWEEHRASWISWPHKEDDWPGKLDAVCWAFAEITRLLAESELVEILCCDEEVAEQAARYLKKQGAPESHYRLHIVKSDRSWLRDSGPTGVLTEGEKLEFVNWKFNAWAKYEDHSLDSEVAKAISELSGKNKIKALRPDNSEPLVLEGGAIEVDGEGSLLTTEQCLLSEKQQRNPGMTRADYELAFKSYLGVEKTIWLKDGICGDDTNGHIDDLARFVAPGVVLLALEEDRSKPNYEASQENLEILKKAKDAQNRDISVATLPMPSPAYFEGELLPASYANFYIANKVVLVPTFNDEKDRKALETIAAFFPDRKTIGLHSVDLILGLGAIHCLTQQEPLENTAKPPI